jgi:hypothetical protein
MLVRHNTKLLEQALDHVVKRAAIPTIQAEAEALHKKARAASVRRLATGTAIALAAIGIGVGVHLGYWVPEYRSAPGTDATARIETKSVERSSDPSTPSKEETPSASSTEAKVGIATKTEEGNLEPTTSAKPVPPATEIAQPSESIATPANDPPIVTTNYNIFRETTATLLGNTWPIKAGHYFANETDPIWQYAWCYTGREVDGVEVHVQLARRNTPFARPEGPIATPATLERVGLTEEAALALATKCSWMDEKRFGVADFEPTPGRRNPFETAKPDVKISGNTLKYTGEIEGNFHEILQRYEFEVLEIESMGGLIHTAITVGNWLRATGKIVRVEKTCLSACVLVLAGGKMRTASEVARIGVHRFYSTRDGNAREAMEWAQLTSSEIISFLQSMGVDVALFHAMASVPADNMEFLPHEKLRQWKLIGGEGEVAADELMPSFVRYDGFDAIGHDLVGMPIRNLTFDQCKVECTKIPGCRALSYNKSATACFLKNDASVVFKNEIAFTLVEKELEAHVRKSKLDFYENVSLGGEPYRAETGLGYVECVLLCEKDTKCIGFNFDRTQKSCVLLNYVGEQRATPNFLSGEKFN